jgi:hypothetical protein
MALSRTGQRCVQSAQLILEASIEVARSRFHHAAAERQ